MTLKDLTEDQKIELKQNILTQRMDARGESPSWDELAIADDLVSDEDLEDWYGDTEFSPDDFVCSTGNDEMEIKTRIREDLNRYYDTDSTYGISDLVEDLRTIAESSGKTDMGHDLKVLLDRYDNKTSFSAESLLFKIDVLLGDEEDY
jgi:hypothetical protein